MDLLCLGCSGFVGSAVRKRLLASGHSLLLVSRNPPQDPQKQESWVSFESDWMDHLIRVDGVVNFAGEPIAGGLWTANRRRAIQESRAGICRKIVDRLGHMDQVPKIWINASAVGYYGDRGEEELAEDSASGSGFLAHVCQDWEAEVARSAVLGVREVRLRLGAVLDANGGILRSLAPLYRHGFGGTLGTGRQYFPWISLEDVANVVDFTLQYPIRGPVNVVSPRTGTQMEFATAFAEVFGKKRGMSAPAWLLRLLPGQMHEILLYGQRAKPVQLQKFGFQFRKPDWKQVLAGLS